MDVRGSCSKDVCNSVCHSALRSGPWDRLGPRNRPDQDHGPGPSNLLEERLEKTAVLGLVKTSLGPI